MNTLSQTFNHSLHASLLASDDSQGLDDRHLQRGNYKDQEGGKEEGREGNVKVIPIHSPLH